MAVINLTYETKAYELTYTRETVRQMERQGFDFAAFARGERPGTLSLQLFEGAFISRHKKMSRREVDDIFDHIDNKSELLVALAEMYNDTLTTLIDTVAEDDGKKVTWEKV